MGVNMKKFIVKMFILLSLSIQTGYCSDYSQEEFINVSVYEKINPSIVFIEAMYNDEVSTGTGIVVGKNGEILTSHHVVAGASNIEVTTHKGEVYKAEIIYKPKNATDLILIKIKSKSSLPVVKLGDSSVLKVGQKVLAIGNPFGFSGTLTTGIISLSFSTLSFLDKFLSG